VGRAGLFGARAPHPFGVALRAMFVGPVDGQNPGDRRLETLMDLVGRAGLFGSCAPHPCGVALWAIPHRRRWASRRWIPGVSRGPFFGGSCWIRTSDQFLKSCDRHYDRVRLVTLSYDKS